MDAARALFGTKWNMIPHRRPIESWTLDVLENPFVRLAYFIDPAHLCEQMSQHGFKLHSSWPRYQDGFAVEWFRRRVPIEDELRRVRDFVQRSRLSYLLGRTHFVVQDDAQLDADLTELVTAVDSFVDRVDASLAHSCVAILHRLAALLGSSGVLSTVEDRQESAALVQSLGRLLVLLADGSPDEIASFCSTDPSFLASWGSPSHFAVFRRVAEDERD
jgi:hypothetical protein